MCSDVDKVRLILSDFRGFFLKTVVGPTYNWFRGLHIRWNPLVGPVSPQWGPLVGPTLLGPTGPTVGPYVGPIC